MLPSTSSSFADHDYCLVLHSGTFCTVLVAMLHTDYLNKHFVQTGLWHFLILATWYRRSFGGTSNKRRIETAIYEIGCSNWASWDWFTTNSTVPATNIHFDIMHTVLISDSLPTRTIGCEMHRNSLTSRCIHFCISARLHLLIKLIDRNRISCSTRHNLSKVSKLTCSLIG